MVVLEVCRKEEGGVYGNEVPLVFAKGFCGESLLEGFE